MTQERTIKINGETWKIIGIGVTREDGKTFTHLASTTRGRHQKNGFVPMQINDWLDLSSVKSL